MVKEDAKGGNDQIVKKALQCIAEQMHFNYEDVVKIALYEYITKNQEKSNTDIYTNSYLTGKTEEEIRKELKFHITDMEDSELIKILTQEYQESVSSDKEYDSAYLPEDVDIDFIEKFIKAYQIKD